MTKKEITVDEMIFLIDQYAELFNDSFPFFELQPATDQEITEIIKKCLEENKPVTEYHNIPYSSDIKY